MLLNRPPLVIITLAIAIVKCLCLVPISVLPDSGCPTEPSQSRGLGQTPPEQGQPGLTTRSEMHLLGKGLVLQHQDQRTEQAGKVLVTNPRPSSSPKDPTNKGLKLLQAPPQQDQAPPPEPTLIQKCFSLNLGTWPECPKRPWRQGTGTRCAHIAPQKERRSGTTTSQQRSSENSLSGGPRGPLCVQCARSRSPPACLSPPPTNKKFNKKSII